MKKILMILITGIVLQSCTPGEDYKAVRTEVLAAHDSVMMDTETAMKDSKMLDALSQNLDSLKKMKPGLDIPKAKQDIAGLKSKISTAEGQMEDWMHQFDADLGKKTNEEALIYFKAEKKKIQSLDSLYKKTLKESEEYISGFK